NDWSGTTTISHGTLKLGAADQVPNGAAAGNVVVNGSNGTLSSVLDLNGFNETINGLSSAGDLTKVLVSNGSGSTSVGAVAVLTVGDNNASGNFGGSIQNGNGGLSISKIGTGTQTLSGSNSYTGVTTIAGGTLVARGAN